MIDLPPQSRARVVEIYAGRGLKTRLLQMGLTPGTELEIVFNDRRIVVIRFRETIVTLSRGIAMKILVEPVEKSL